MYPCRTVIQWFHIKHYLDYQAVFLSGARKMCFFMIHDFGSPTIDQFFHTYACQHCLTTGMRNSHLMMYEALLSISPVGRGQ